MKPTPNAGSPSSTPRLAGPVVVVAALASTVAGFAPHCRAQGPVELAGRVSAERCKATVEALAAFGTRHTMSDQESPVRGIGAARRWIEAELRAAAGDGPMRVWLDDFEQPAGGRVPAPVRIVNVVAEIPGSMPEAAGRRYLVMGHYDSRAGDGADAAADAPGANDDASGTAVAMELARVLSRTPLESTVVFVATAGEEQGLLGAVHLAALAKEMGWDIRGVLNNDIVGDPRGPDDLPWSVEAGGEVRVFSEGLPRNPPAEQLARLRGLSAESDSSSRQLARFVAEVAETSGADLPVRPRLVFRPDRFLRGGDHSPFNDAGFAAVRFTVPFEHYDRQHQDVTIRDGRPYGDVPEFVDAEYVAAVARLNLVTLVSLANAPSSPARCRVITAGLANDTTVRWEASPEPDTAGYEVVWRATTQAAWTGSIDAGNVTELTVPVSKDDAFFGVRAYDRDGYKSPVAFAGAEAR